MEHYYSGRAGELVTVDDGVSQGSPEGTPFAITAIHGFVNEALHAHPDTAQQFVSLILDHLAQYFDLKLKTDQQNASIDPDAPLGSHELDAFAKISAPRPLGLRFS